VVQRERRAVATAVLLVLALTALAWWSVRAAERRDEHASLRAESLTLAAQVERELGRLADVGLDAAVALPPVPELDPVSYAATMEALRVADRFPGLHGVTFVEVVPRTELDTWRAARGDDGQPFELRTDAGQPVLRPIAFGYPLATNEAAIGVDVMGLPESAAAAERAAATGEPALSAATRIVQLPPDVPGAVMHVPVLGPDGAVAANLAMIFSGQLLFDQLAPLPEHLAITLHDRDSPRFDVVADVGGPAAPGAPTAESPVTIAGEHWSVEVAPLPGRGPAWPLRGSTWLAVGGLVAAVLVGSLVRSLVSRERIASELVHRRTAELRGLNVELAATNEALATANRSKDAFLASVSHELRTPLTVIAGFTESLRRLPAGSQPAAELLTPIERNVRRLDLLVGDLLTIAGLDADAVQAFRQPVDLADVLDNAPRELAGAADGEVQVSVEPGLRALVDPRHLERVVANLVVNALRHGAPPVELAARAAGARVQVAVRDHGAGIPAEHRDRVFDRFVQGDASRATGTGLGLAIVRELVELNGGRVRYEPADPGARFVVELDGAPAAPDPPRVRPRTRRIRPGAG
jgi:signal transduction histidine kinase